MPKTSKGGSKSGASRRVARVVAREQGFGDCSSDDDDDEIEDGVMELCTGELLDQMSRYTDISRRHEGKPVAMGG